MTPAWSPCDGDMIESEGMTAGRCLDGEGSEEIVSLNKSLDERKKKKSEQVDPRTFCKPESWVSVLRFPSPSFLYLTDH